MKNIVVLGSSGSIGQNALWVASRFPEEFNIYGLSVHSNIDTLETQIEKFNPKVVCVSNEDAASRIDSKSFRDIEIVSGADGLEKLASRPEVDIVVNAVVGFAGLRSTYAAAKAGKKIALANKESMVAGGELINRTVASNGAEIIPVDSEHSAIFQCLKSGSKQKVRRVLLTSSGGPFRNYNKDKMPDITVAQALNHPTWNMGKKISIDSATLMNKGLEIIEAVYLFDLTPEKIDVVIHPQSIVHSMVEYIDGSIIAQLSRPDMRLPIHYALFYPSRADLNAADLSFNKKFSLDFEPPDNDKFPSLNLARQALKSGNSAPAIFNASNELAVEAFIDGRVKFTDIFYIVKETLNISEQISVDSIEAIIEADNIGRTIAKKVILKIGA